MGLLKKLFGKNLHLSSSPLEEVKMKIKITKDEPSQFGNISGVGRQSTGTTITQKAQNKDPVFISLRNQVVVRDSRLKFISMSKKTGYPIYEVIGDDMSFLSKYSCGYSEIITSANKESSKTVSKFGSDYIRKGYYK